MARKWMVRCMQLPLGPTLAAFALLALSASAQAQLLLFTFDNASGNNAASTGTNTTVTTNVGSNAGVTPSYTDGAGVTGLPGDRALNLTGAAGMGTAGEVASPGPQFGSSRINFDSATNPTPLVGVKSFTLTGWMKSGTAFGNGARLMTYAESNTGFQLVGGTNGVFTLFLNNGVINSSLTYAETDTWLFFAITFDGNLSSNNLTFYKGVLGGGALTSQVTTIAQTGMTATPNPNTDLVFGNNNTTGGTRPYDGYLDNLAIYAGTGTSSAGALSSTQVQALFTSVVPEPGSLAFILGGGLLYTLATGRGRRRANR
jgi:hypothetical protein